MKGSRGFTLIELVMVIVILGILAAVAIPIYYNLNDQARDAAEKGVVGGVRSGIYTYFVGVSLAGGSHAYPTVLDAATAGTATNVNPFFDKVLSQGGVTQDWTKSGTKVYTGPKGGVYTYNSGTGAFK